MNAREIEPTIKRVIANHIDFDESYVFLFGSRAGGRHHPSSDYDIGLYRGEKFPLRVIARIKDELEEYPIPVEVELVDFAAASREFKELALREIELWNKPKTSLKLI